MVTFWLLFAVSLIQSSVPSKALIQDDFISSNDTIELKLSTCFKRARVFSGPPGSKVDYEFILNNHWEDGIFSIKQSSDDGFLAEIRDDDRAFFLKHGSQRVIRVSNLVVPYRKEGEKVKFTLIAEKHQEGINSGLEGVGAHSGPELTKRGSDSRGSGQGSGGHESGERGTFSGEKLEDIGTYTSQESTGARIHTGQVFKERESYTDHVSGSGGILTDQISETHTTYGYRIKASVTVEFTVTAEQTADTSKPWVHFKNGAKSIREGCPIGPGNPGCEENDWLARFYVQDDQSGIRMVTVEPVGEEPPDKPLYYRYVNFHIGSNREHEVIAIASCCLEGLSFQAVDVAGNKAIQPGKWNAFPQGVSRTAIKGTVGGIVAFVLIIVIPLVAVIIVQKKAVTSSQMPLFHR